MVIDAARLARVEFYNFEAIIGFTAGNIYDKKIRAYCLGNAFKRGQFFVRKPTGIIWHFLKISRF